MLRGLARISSGMTTNVDKIFLVHNRVKTTAGLHCCAERKIHRYHLTKVVNSSFCLSRGFPYPPFEVFRAIVYAFAELLHSPVGAIISLQSYLQFRMHIIYNTASIFCGIAAHSLGFRFSRVTVSYNCLVRYK